mgnify:CR=1 FL=1
MDAAAVLERKFQPVAGAAPGALALGEGAVLTGYASLFGVPDKGGDVVMPGAYGASLAALAAEGRRVKMLWQHDPAQPIGVWDELREDARGLFVKGRLLTEVARGREALALVASGAVDGLSIGYRTRRAVRDGQGRRQLLELELWEVSLVTFPMLPQARVAAKAEPGDGSAEGAEATAVLAALTGACRAARVALAGRATTGTRRAGR